MTSDTLDENAGGPGLGVSSGGAGEDGGADGEEGVALTGAAVALDGAGVAPVSAAPHAAAEAHANMRTPRWRSFGFSGMHNSKAFVTPAVTES
ncbi:hypothetical protein [Sphaerisporangium krabiense]|uniref:hypothetical protein n=1 Tax=Sphaerisporangium krabiense TaxID=763782 RepID=UPI001EF19874|nr:hypothetical protein [Sphaerisporangium krabiense]